MKRYRIISDVNIFNTTCHQMTI